MSEFSTYEGDGERVGTSKRPAWEMAVLNYNEACRAADVRDLRVRAEALRDALEASVARHLYLLREIEKAIKKRGVRKRLEELVRNATGVPK